MSALLSASARDRLIVALDYPDAASAMALTSALGETVRWYKVGLELYLAAGNAVVAGLIDRGHSVFLDLKFHDIPNTVAGAVRVATRSGASLLTVHAGGGQAMLEAAVEAAAGFKAGPRILAVTLLTSLDREQLAATGIAGSPAGQVERLAMMAIAAGADGLVCSAEESAGLRGKLGSGPLLVTPGIRPAGSAMGDQRRIATPAEAVRNGATYLVVGRPVTQAADPKQAAEAILEEMEATLVESPA